MSGGLHFLFGGWTPDAKFYAIIGAGLALIAVIAVRMLGRALFGWLLRRLPSRRRRPATPKPTPRRRPTSTPPRRPRSTSKRRPAKAGRR